MSNTYTPLPSDATGDALRRIADDGSDLTRPMAFDFFVAVPTQRAGVQVAHEARALGFETSVESDSTASGWTCYCRKVIIPDYPTVVAIEQQLDAIGRRYGGNADGFGSFGNAEDGGTPTDGLIS